MSVLYLAQPTRYDDRISLRTSYNLGLVSGFKSCHARAKSAASLAIR